MEPTIRAARDEDLPALIRQLGQRHYFTERLLRQRHNRGRLFVALIAAQPVGVIYASVEKADEPELRLHLPAVPLLQHLEVRDGFRNQGIGKRLIASAEQFLIGLQYRQVALGVALDNDDAIRLYRLLGYREWELSPTTTFREHHDADGRVHKEREDCRIFVKALVADNRRTDGG